MTDVMTDVVASGMSSGRVCSNPKKLAVGGFRRCWSLDFARCPSCARLQAMYTKMIIGDGFTKKGHFFFLTLTAPSFGRVHTVPHSPDDPVRSCRCGSVHEYGSVLAGVPLDLDKYKHREQVLWNNNSSELFRYTRGYLDAALGDVSFDYCAVREYQQRGAIHFHVMIRVPMKADVNKVFEVLRGAREYQYKGYKWGRQFDVELIDVGDSENTVRYVSKVVGYSTKRLGLTSPSLSDEQREFFMRLDSASSRLGLSAGVIRGLGFGGHMMTSSRGWSKLSKRSLRDEARVFAENNPDDGSRDAERAAVVEMKREIAQGVASRLGVTGDYTVSSTAPAELRERLFGSGSIVMPIPSRNPVPAPNDELDEFLGEWGVLGDVGVFGERTDDIYDEVF